MPLVIALVIAAVWLFVVAISIALCVAGAQADQTQPVAPDRARAGDVARSDEAAAPERVTATVR